MVISRHDTKGNGGSDMDIKTTAITLVRATEIFTDFFKRKPNMNDIDDVKELLAIQCDVIYTLENIDRRNGN